MYFETIAPIFFIIEIFLVMMIFASAMKNTVVAKHKTRKNFFILSCVIAINLLVALILGKPAQLSPALFWGFFVFAAAICAVCFLLSKSYKAEIRIPELS